MKKRIPKVFLLLFFLNIAIGMSLALGVTEVKAEEVEFFNLNSNIDTWQDETSLLDVSTQVDDSGLHLNFDGGAQTEEYEYLLVFVNSKEICSSKDADVIAIDYEYTGQEACYMTFSLNDFNGGKVETTGEYTYLKKNMEESEEGLRLSKSENGQIYVAPGEHVTLYVPYNQLADTDFSEDCIYGLTFSFLIPQQDNASINISRISAESSGELAQVAVVEYEEIVGNEIVYTPYLGIYEYGYSTDKTDADVVALELPAGIRMEENKLVLTDESQTGTVILYANITNEVYVEKQVQIVKAIDVGYTFEKNDSVSEIKYPLQIFSDKKEINIVRGIGGVALVCAIVLFFVVSVRIKKMQKKEKWGEF